MVAPMEVLEHDQPTPALREGRSDHELGGRTLERFALKVRFVLPLDAEERPRDPFARRLPSLQGDRLHQIGDLRPDDLGGSDSLTPARSRIKRRYCA